MSSSRQKLTRWETLGAWTGIWTPPKDVEVPPVPVRKLALWGLAALVVIGVALALAIPPLEHGKRAGASRLAREQAAQVAAEAARLRADQRVHRARFSGDPVARLEAAISADAKARVAAGKLDGPIVATTCEAAAAHAIRYPSSRVYNCFVATASNVRGEGRDLLDEGYPFIATVYFAKHQLAWCKKNPQPGEKTRGHGLARVAMSPVCAGRLAPLL
jgi:hypothetical protein